jgi:Domain of unknown function (DUF4249)
MINNCHFRNDMRSEGDKNMVLIIGLFLLTMTIAYSCKKPYALKTTSANINYLVVEGVINTGKDSTIFNLTRTINLATGVDTAAELGAQVTVEDNNSASYAIPEIGKGKYAAPPLGLDSTKQYRIRIKTTDAKEYVSDLTQSKPTPPIDSVGYTTKGNGIQIYVNAHDAKNSTRYYRWDYQETWQFHAKYFSSYITDGNAIQARTPDQNIYYCFTGDVSSSITLGSSAKLVQDVIYQAPVIFIPSTSEKIETRYSILLKQYALTVDAFNYWQNLKKNTEQLGSIFDAQPSEVTGNIHCLTDASIPVIGYISAGSVKQKRIYIDNSQLSDSWLPAYPYDCQEDTSFFCKAPYCTNQVITDLIPFGSEEIPIGQAFKNGAVIGYTESSTECVDCTIRGTKRAPSFWK